MLIGSNSNFLLKQTRSKAKMYEYNIPDELHIAIPDNANELLLLAIAAIGNISAEIINKKKAYRVVPQGKKDELVFASKYFDAFFTSKILPSYNQYYLLLGSVAYYFCDYIGSSKVMANMINTSNLNLESNGIERVLAQVLKDDVTSTESSDLLYGESIYKEYLKQVEECYNAFFKRRETVDLSFIDNFRRFVYAQGSPRELLLADAMCAILLTKMERSALHLLPLYSGVYQETWGSILANSRINELWPAQISLGEAGVFSGNSAVIQMPTSSGKTTSMSIVIRAAFMAKRTATAVVVAPFRALCSEISNDLSRDFSDDARVHINEFSDIFEIEDIFDFFSSFGQDDKSIMILTPEKLIYLLRQDQELIKRVGLIIFDEAHMFDDASRGTRYELLMSTILLSLEGNTQKLLLSAVVPNANEINEWFTGGEGQVIANNSIRSTEKSIAIVDWEKHNNKNYAYLYFIDSDDMNSLEFYVPRIVEVTPLNKLRKNEIQRFFPQVNFINSTIEHNDMAIYLALKLNHNGGVAIFCGKKISVEKVLKRVLEIEKRGVDISSFQNNSNSNENERIALLIKENYGQENVYYQSAKKGAFAHHGGISNGIRISIEYAMREGLIKLIVCTSTLAQGVNLPIRYLIISSLYQSRERIKVRDFHNLIGRAGRAGLYTEGTIILSESFVYSRRSTRDHWWRWKGYLNMLNPRNAESCLSQLLLLVRPITVDISYQKISLNLNELALSRYDDSGSYERILDSLTNLFSTHFSEKTDLLKSYIYQMNVCLDDIESYVLSYLNGGEENYLPLEEIVSNTFGYYLADKDERSKLTALFGVVRDYLLIHIDNEKKRVVYSRTLLNTKQLFLLEEWTNTNSKELLNCVSSNELLQIVISQIIRFSDNRTLQSIVTKANISNIAEMWINGNSYKQILDYALEADMILIKLKREKQLDLNDVISICDSGFGYSATMIINAISELLALNFKADNYEKTCALLGELNARMRYGLPSKKSVYIYEAGFSDRVVALKLTNRLSGIQIKSKRQFTIVARKNKETLLEVLADYPEVFTDRLNTI